LSRHAARQRPQDPGAYDEQVEEVPKRSDKQYLCLISVK
jgi:hypothetical protein